MDEFYKRAELLIGDQALSKLNKSSVAVFGVGGVGGFAVESLIRSGIKNITVFDGDVVEESNINRQIIATVDTVGKDKTEAVIERAKSINPDVNITAHKIFYLPENANQFDLSKFDCIIDAIDTVSAKIEIIKRAKETGAFVISCMGTGGKMNPLSLKVDDIEKTSVCPLARVMRRELKNRNIHGVKVVYSTEESSGNFNDGEKHAIPSMIFVPATAGIILANEVVKHIIKG